MQNSTTARIFQVFLGFKLPQKGVRRYVVSAVPNNNYTVLFSSAVTAIQRAVGDTEDSWMIQRRVSDTVESRGYRGQLGDTEKSG